MKSSGYARVVEWIREGWGELDSNVIADDIEETMDDLNSTDDGEEWDQATQAIIDSSEDDNEDANELENLLYIYFELFNT